MCEENRVKKVRNRGIGKMLEEGCESRPSTRVCRVQANLSGSTRMIYWHMGKLLRHVKFRPALRTFTKSDRERERERRRKETRGKRGKKVKLKEHRDEAK